MKKRVVSILLCAVMTLSILSGCGSSKEEASAPVSSADDAMEEVSSEGNEESSIWLIGDEDSAELSLGIAVGVTDKEPDDMWFFKHYEKMTGVHMDVTTVLEQDWKDKIQVMMASGEYPGIIWCSNNTKWSSEEMAEYSNDGTFLDLTDYLEYMPNYKREMDKIEGSWKAVTAPDGGMYSLASINPALYDTENKTWINHEWLANVGLEVPETLDDFYNVLKAFKEQDADGDGNTDNEIPYSSFFGTDDDSIRTFMLNAFGFDTEGNPKFNVGIQSWDGEVVYMPMTERYKEYLEYMKKLMDEGLLDQDLFSQDLTQYHAKTSEGICGVIGDRPSSADSDAYESYTRFILKYDENSEKVVFQYNPVQYGSVVITDNCEDPVLAAKWIDLFYAPENAYNLQAGPIVVQYPDGTQEIWTEGVEENPGIGCVIEVDEEGNFVAVSFPGVDETLGAWAWLCLEHPAQTMFNTTIGEYYYYGELFGGWPSNVEEEYEFERARYENADNDPSSRWLGYERASDIAAAYEYRSFGYPQVYLSAEQQEWVNEHKTILEDYVLQMEAKFITGAADLDTEYDAFIEELKNKGAEEYLDIYVDLYNG